MVAKWLVAHRIYQLVLILPPENLAGNEECMLSLKASDLLVAINDAGDRIQFSTCFLGFR